MSNPEPIYHTLQPTNMDESPPDPYTMGQPNMEDSYYTSDGTTSPPSELHSLSDLQRTSNEPPPAYEPRYEPGYETRAGPEEDQALWVGSNINTNYPIASQSRDAYGIDDDDDDDEADGNRPKCGWGKFTPKCLQACLNVKAYLVVFAMIGLVQIMTSYGLVPIAITTIERRFHLSSFQSGAIMSAYQFATMAFTVFITYIGEHRHKPRWVGLGSLFLCIGSVIFTLPHFLSGYYVYQDYGDYVDGVCPAVNLTAGQPAAGEMCDTGNDAEAGEDSPSNYFWLFILAQLFNSLASAPLFTLGITYMDDNLSTKDFGMYMGICNALLSFGPAAGYFIGAITLSLYTDFHADMSRVTITPDNPLWIGAWWLGFLISAVLVAIFAFFILAFPKALPGMKRIQRERQNQSQKGSEFTVRPGLGNSIRDFPGALVKVLSNIPFLCLSCIAVTEYFVAGGIVMFAPKFLESQFNINARDVGKYVGLMGLTQYCSASLISGGLIKKFDLKFRGIIKMCTLSVFCSLLAGLVYITHCPNAPIAGVTVQYINISTPIAGDEGTLLAECNAHCACSENFEPVCGDDNVMYFSPCHAGCNEESHINGTLQYSDCQCITSYATTTSSYDDVTTNSGIDLLVYGGAVPGRCQTDCSKKWMYLALLWLFGFFGTMQAIPAWIATMRCVSHSQRAFALGVQSIFYSGLGTAPAPIIFGLIIDRACLFWNISSCDGGKGSCWVYDNKTFAHSFLLIIMCFKSASVLLFILTHCCYKPTEDQMDAGDVYGPRRKRVPTTEL